MSSKGLDNSNEFFKNSQVEDSEEGIQKYAVDLPEGELQKQSKLELKVLTNSQKK